MGCRRIDGIVAALLLGASAPAQAAPAVNFDVAPGDLGQALIDLGRQAHITVGVTDPEAGRSLSPGVHGRMELRRALTRILAGTGYTFVLTGGAVRIVREEPGRGPRPRSPVIGALRASPPSPPQADIVITASKQDVRLSRFGGTVQLIDLNPSQLGRRGSEGTEAVLDLLPAVASTHLGPGRDKIYVRGVADSSFNGPSQSVVGLYLGDVRLTYNAPDPDLALYDIDRVELLEGPQGALYGTGSLGGILRLVPNRPNLGQLSGFVSAGAMSTAHGGWGEDASGMINLPLAKDRIALRALVYGSDSPGYIDDAQLGLRGINRTRISGWRAALRIDAGNGWDVELGGLGQDITGKDGQYALSTLPPLTRAANFRQPFDNDYHLGSITVRKQLRDFDVVSATGIVRHQLESRFDATGFPGTSGPQLFAEAIDISMVSHETRLSHSDARGAGWVAGFALVHDIDEISRRLGPSGALAPLSRLRNEASEVALFGQFGFALAPWAILAVGGRVTYSTEEGSVGQVATDFEEPRRHMVRFSPSARMTFPINETAVAYVRYERAHRAGGLAVSGSGPGESVRRFKTDSLASIEAGIRVGELARDRFELAASASRAWWDDVQADLIDTSGLPFTTNLGDGRITGLELQGRWRPVREVTLEAAAFFNDSDLNQFDPAVPAGAKGDFPNVADTGARGAIRFDKQLGPGAILSLSSSLRYVGKSRLGLGAPLNLHQGGYSVGDAGARLTLGRTGVSLDVTNIGDVRGNQFSLGNPFSVAAGNQITPLRPRTVRLGIDRAF
jgi:outer membrane receptor protein involved in Fe transport